MSTPGTYSEDDETPVRFSDAMNAWTELAHQELLATACRYRAVITYGELAEAAQSKSGIRTRMLLANWIGGLLEAVAQRCADAGDAPLTALCVHQDGTIGSGYRGAPKHRGAEDPDPDDDLEVMAARDRLTCYRAYADDLPADGGQPALTRQVEERRQRARKTEPPAAPVKVCPKCWTQLPLTGICDCDR